MKNITTYYLITQFNKTFNYKIVESVNRYSQLGYNAFIYLTLTNIHATAIRESSKTKSKKCY
jgi:hypothetical protein